MDDAGHSLLAVACGVRQLTTRPLLLLVEQVLLQPGPGVGEHPPDVCLVVAVRLVVVAHRAAAAAAAVPAADRPVLVAAAWLHDIGYAEPLLRSGFHPSTAPGTCRQTPGQSRSPGWRPTTRPPGWSPRVRGLADPTGCFPAPRYAWGPVADALTFVDQTTGPDGEVTDVEDRLADMLPRHGPDSPNARAHAQRAPAIRAAVHRTELRLRAAT